MRDDARGAGDAGFGAGNARGAGGSGSVGGGGSAAGGTGSAGGWGQAKADPPESWHNVIGASPEELRQAELDSMVRYWDIIDLPAPVSRNHPRQPANIRAAQFSPFAALNGFGEQIDDTAEQARQGFDELGYRAGERGGEEPEVSVRVWGSGDGRAGGSAGGKSAGGMRAGGPAGGGRAAGPASGGGAGSGRAAEPAGSVADPAAKDAAAALPGPAAPPDQEDQTAELEEFIKAGIRYGRPARRVLDLSHHNGAAGTRPAGEQAATHQTRTRRDERGRK